LDRKDYIGWAKGLLKAGYATSPDYAEKLIGIIEDLQLNRFDEGGNNDPILVTKPRKRNQNEEGIFYNNDVKATITDGKVSLEQLAGRFGVSARSLRDYNECVKDIRSPLPDSMIVYLQSKNSYSHDRATKYHYVRRGETMCDISQRYGIDLEKLYKKNNMPFGTEPAANERLILRRSNIFGLWLEKWNTPKLRNKNEPNNGKPSEFGDPVPPSVPVPSPNNKPNTQRPKPEKEKPIPPQKTKNEEDTLFEIEPNEIKSTSPTPPSKPKVPPTPQGPFETEPAPNKPTSSNANANNNLPISGVHVVAKGETLWAIARKYNVSVDVLKKLNNLTTNNIATGQRLKVK
jgi:LysM repeat protein